jgi:hypothetical protein
VAAGVLPTAVDRWPRRPHRWSRRSLRDDRWSRRSLCDRHETPLPVRCWPLWVGSPLYDRRGCSPLLVAALSPRPCPGLTLREVLAGVAVAEVHQWVAAGVRPTAVDRWPRRSQPPLVEEVAPRHRWSRRSLCDRHETPLPAPCGPQRAGSSVYEGRGGSPSLVAALSPGPARASRCLRCSLGLRSGGRTSGGGRRAPHGVGRWLRCETRQRRASKPRQRATVRPTTHSRDPLSTGGLWVLGCVGCSILNRSHGSRACAEDTTGSRPPAAPTTRCSPPAPTTGRRPRGPTWSTPPAPTSSPGRHRPPRPRSSYPAPHPATGGATGMSGGGFEARR